MFTGVLSAAIVLSMCVTASFAAGPRCGRYYVDANGDGICNNAGSRCAYVDSDGDGICDNYQSGQDQGCGRSGQCGRGNGFRGGRGR